MKVYLIERYFFYLNIARFYKRLLKNFMSKRILMLDRYDDDRVMMFFS